MARRVLVTRPEPGASATAQRLCERGFFPIVMPLTEIVALAVDAGAMPDVWSAVAVTSGSAIRLAPADLLAKLVGSEVFCVGEATAKAARKAGFRRVTEGSGDASGLARTVVAAGLDGPVVYLCGKVRRPDFEDVLASAGLTVKAIETYDTVAAILPNDIASRFHDPVEAALVYSEMAATALKGLIARHGLGDCFAETVFLCLSQRVAAALKPQSPAKIRVAPEPSEKALLSLL